MERIASGLVANGIHDFKKCLLIFQPVVHAFIHAEAIIIDGETHRAKLQAKASISTLNTLLEIKDSETHLAPELVLQEIDEATIQTDVWSTTSILLGMFA